MNRTKEVGTRKNKNTIISLQYTVGLLRQSCNLDFINTDKYTNKINNVIIHN